MTQPPADPSVASPPALDVERTVALLNDWAEEWTERADMSRIGAGYRYSEDSEVKQAHARQMAVEADANVGLLRALASALPGMVRDGEQSTGVRLIATERQRQTQVEGWSPEHDAAHGDEQMATAAACYIQDDFMPRNVPAAWPWEDFWWKPSKDRVRNLVKAGALVAAEIDRLLAARSASRPGGDPT